MILNVYATEDHDSHGTAPFLFVPASPEPVLPPHPGALEWKYFATIDERDQMLIIDWPTAEAALLLMGYYIAKRLV